MTILDSYSNDFPLPENAISIFNEEWASDIPIAMGGVGGKAQLFIDKRLIDIIEHCGGLAGKKCLELGPLEGGHTYIMWRSGAQSIISIEANQRAFLKCLITKEIMGYEAKFLLGDFVKYVTTTTQRFDFTNMSGVLYHMTAPHELVANVARISDQVACWTHYFDGEVLKEQSVRFDFEPKFVDARGMEVGLFKQRYLNSIQNPDFCGGKEEFSYWLERSDVLALFDNMGFETNVLSEDPDHPNGPCMNFYALRRQS